MPVRIILAALLLITTSCCAPDIVAERRDGTLVISRDGRMVLGYQYEPMTKPQGGEKFRGSNFIHPLYTPSGFCVTDLQPADHLHHFGLWWPWKQLRVEGREIITWELQKGEGLVEARSAAPTKTGFTAQSDYIDRTAPDGPLTVLNETAIVEVADFQTDSANGYSLDIEIIHRCATDQPVEVMKYRYSGFAIRGAPGWNRENSTILTSEGKGRDEANFTAAQWIKAEGAAVEGATAGILMMGAPSNHAHPERLRTWDKQHNGAIFINFNPVQEASWLFEPGREYTRRYRAFVYDGKLNEEQADRLWKEYSNE